MSLDPSRVMPRNDRDWLRWCSNQRVFENWIKELDQTKNSDTTLADDDELVITVSAERQYTLKLIVFFDTPATPDFKFAITGPASPTEVVIVGYAFPVAATSPDWIHDVAFGTSHAVTGTGGTTGGYIELSINLINGANDGQIAFQWAQNTSDAADTTVLAGSYFAYDKR